MLWTAPTTGIAVCQNAVLFGEPRMSWFGYKQTSRTVSDDGCFTPRSGSRSQRPTSPALPLEARQSAADGHRSGFWPEGFLPPYSPEVIRLAEMMYICFPLSLRQVEDLLFERGSIHSVPDNFPPR
jgi:hypothetical protein